MKQNRKSGGVTIGKVSGGITNSIIAGRDVKNATITVGGQLIAADKKPNIDELKQLLTEIQQEVAQLRVSQQDALKALSAGTPFIAQGVEETVKEASEKINLEMKSEDAESVQQSLTEATNFLTGILDGARSVAEKAGALAGAVSPLAENLAPLVDKVSVAAFWVAKLWLQQ